jgi:hypothetical protein
LLGEEIAVEDADFPVDFAEAGTLCFRIRIRLNCGEGTEAIYRFRVFDEARPLLVRVIRDMAEITRWVLQLFPISSHNVRMNTPIVTAFSRSTILRQFTMEEKRVTPLAFLFRRGKTTSRIVVVARVLMVRREGRTT